MSRWLSQELRMPSHHVLPVTVNLPLQNVDLPSHRQSTMISLGTCDGINADITKHCFFGKGNVDISRSYDLVNFRDALRSKGKGCDCLCTTDFINRIDSASLAATNVDG